MNNDTTIKCRIGGNLGIALKTILEKKKLTQQEFLEKLIQQFILDNISLVLEEEKKWKKKE